MNPYTVGQEIELTAAFTNDDGDPIDPAAVVCKIIEPDGVVQTPAPVVHVASGSYLVNFTPTKVGLHEYRFAGTTGGLAVSAGESAFLTTSDFVGA